MTAKSLYQGVSVSSQQGHIDYHRLAQHDIDLIYIRSTVGNNYLDPNLQHNYTFARRNKFKVGFYHDMIARTAEEAETEARFFLSALGNYQTDCRLVMDFPYARGLSIASLNRLATIFLRKTRELGQVPLMLYADTYYATLLYNQQVTIYPLWVAQYGADQPSDKIKWPRWSGFEYTNQAHFPGIPQLLQLSQFRQETFLAEPQTIPETLRQRYYTVNNGDTLWWIAQQYAVSPDTLCELNNLDGSQILEHGQILRLPFPRQPEQHSYVVKPGDTLYEIAQTLHTSVGRLVGVNKIRLPYLIQSGQVLAY